MIYNEEQWKVISNASPHFETARHDYIRNATRKMTQDIIEVFEAATGKKIAHRDLTCAVCVLRIYQIISNTYFKDLEERKNNSNKIMEDGKKESCDKKPKIKDAKVKTRDKKKEGRGSGTLQKRMVKEGNI